MTNVIELAKKCGALTGIKSILNVDADAIVIMPEELQAFYDAAQKEQMEKDAKICDELGDAAKLAITDSAWQHGECASAIRNQLVKQND